MNSEWMGSIILALLIATITFQLKIGNRSVRSAVTSHVSRTQRDIYTILMRGCCAWYLQLELRLLFCGRVLINKAAQRTSCSTTVQSLCLWLLSLCPRTVACDSGAYTMWWVVTALQTARHTTCLQTRVPLLRE